MFFYLCLAVASTFMFRARVPVLTLFFSALVIVGLVAPNHSAAFVTYTDPILFEFLMGCLIAELLAGGRLRFGPVTSVMLIVTGGVALAASLASSDPAPLRVIYWGLPSFLIVLGVARGEQFFNFGALRVATAIGDSSYSLYLTHGLVLSAIALLFRVQILQALGGLPFACVLFAACLLAGWLCWRYVERPLTSFLNRQLRGPVSGTR